MCVRVDPFGIGYDFVVDRFLNAFVNQEGTETFIAVLNSEVTNPALASVDNCDDGICMLQITFPGRFFGKMKPPPLSIRGSVALVSGRDGRSLSICDNDECIDDTMVPHMVDMEVIVSNEDASDGASDGASGGANVLYIVCLVALSSSTTTFLVLRIIKWGKVKR